MCAAGKFPRRLGKTVCKDRNDSAIFASVASKLKSDVVDLNAQSELVVQCMMINFRDHHFCDGLHDVLLHVYQPVIDTMILKI